jgi:hypothetical protein
MPGDPVDGVHGLHMVRYPKANIESFPVFTESIPTSVVTAIVILSAPLQLDH